MCYIAKSVTLSVVSRNTYALFFIEIVVKSKNIVITNNNVPYKSHVVSARLVECFAGLKIIFFINKVLIL